MRNLVLFLLALVSTAFVSAEPIDGGRAQIEVISERNAVQAGETFFAAFDMHLDEGWHVYWRNPGDAGLPPMVSWDGAGAELAGEFVWPIPHELPVVEGQIMDYGFDERLVLPFPVTVPEDAAGLIQLTGRLDYLICEEICIPEAVDFNFVLPVATSARINTESGQLIADWIRKVPTPLSGEACLTDVGELWQLSATGSELAKPATHLRYFPYQDEISHSAPQLASFGPAGASLQLTPGDDPEAPEGIDGVLVVEQGVSRIGYEFAAKACAVLAGTTSRLGGQVQGGNSVNLFTIGFLALIGGLILNLMPCVLPVLSIKAVGMVQAAATGETVELRRHGLWYTFGVVLSFLAIALTFVLLRSAGEFLSIGFQLQYPVAVALLALLMFVIGLWLLGVFEFGLSVQGIGSGLASRGGSAGAFFTGVLAAIVGAPCIGPFLGVALGAVITAPALTVFLVFGLVGLGLALPFLALSYVPGLQRRLPKPGAWMERLKQFFAFPMFLTAAWLLSVLGGQAGAGPVAWTVAGAAAIGFGVWALQNAGGTMRMLGRGFGVLAVIAGLALPVQASLSAKLPNASTGHADYAEDYGVETWSPNLVAERLAEGKGVFVDFTASWCATCQLNKATTLKRRDVQAAFAENDIVFMVADFTNRDDAIAAELQLRGRPGVPMYLLYAPGNDVPEILPQVLSKGFILDQVAALGN